MPEFTSNYLTTTHLGEFYWMAHPTEAPYKAPTMPDVVNGDMMQAFISDYTINSAGVSLCADRLY